MPIAYLTIPGSAVKVEGRSLLVTKDDERLASLEAVHLDALVLIGRVAITTPALVVLLQERISAAFLSRSGRIWGRLVPRTDGAVDARLAQYATALDPGSRLELARPIVARKIRAMRAQIHRATGNHPDRRNADLAPRLQAADRAARGAASLRTLLGIEGAAAAAYWSGFARLNLSELPFAGRTTRPPRDPVNALLSLGYSLLVNEVWSELDAIGLDPFLGFYHQPQAKRPALALDLAEPFRHAVVDRVVLRATNQRRFQPCDFSETSDGGFLLTRRAVRRFLAIYERAMLAPADKTLLDPDLPAELSAREGMRRRCEQVLTWFRGRYERPRMSRPGPQRREVA